MATAPGGGTSVRVIVYPHSLQVGGAQRNALETAGELLVRGHDVTVFAQPGPLLDLVRELGLRHAAAPVPRRRPSPAVVRGLAALVHETGADVIHAHEWPPGLEAYLAARGTGARPICSVMSMSVASFLPGDLPVVVGTAQMAEFERRRGRELVGLVEPCVDVTRETPPRPGDLARLSSVKAFRARWGLQQPRTDVVIVGRLAHQLKLEGVLHAVRAVDELAGRHPVRLVVVGGGAGEALVRQAAEAVDRRHGAGTVVLTGELVDPAPAYDCADVVLGMGGSALRAMARARPLVVQGERGYFRRLEPASLEDFTWVGWYGVGRDTASGPATLVRELEPLLRSPGLRRELGSFGRAAVVDRFSVTASAEATEDVYRRLVPAGNVRQRGGLHMARAAARYTSFELRRQVARRRGREEVDDANALPVAARHDAPVLAVGVPVPRAGAQVHDTSHRRHP